MHSYTNTLQGFALAERHLSHKAGVDVLVSSRGQHLGQETGRVHAQITVHWQERNLHVDHMYQHVEKPQGNDRGRDSYPAQADMPILE